MNLITSPTKLVGAIRFTWSIVSLWPCLRLNNCNCSNSWRSAITLPNGIYNADCCRRTSWRPSWLRWVLPARPWSSCPIAFGIRSDSARACSAIRVPRGSGRLRVTNRFSTKCTACWWTWWRKRIARRTVQRCWSSPFRAASQTNLNSKR